MNGEDSTWTGQRAGWISKILAVMVMVSFFVYALPVGHALTRPVIFFVPYPAARVNRAVILHRDMVRRRAILERLDSLSTQMDRAELNRTVMDAFVRRALIRQLLRKNYVRGMREKSRVYLEGEMRTFGGEEAFRAWLEEAYGWSLTQYERHVVRPFVEAKELESFVQSSRSYQEDERARIDGIRAQMDAGEGFDALVLAFSEDATSVFNGDYGWLSRDDLPSAWVGPAEHMDIGQISPVLEEDGRFTILRLDARDETADDLRVNVSALIINKKTLDEVLDDFRKASSVQVYVRF